MLVIRFFVPFAHLSILLFTCSFFGCDDTINQTNIDDKIIPSSNVSFAQHIFPVFEAKCNYSGCHDSAARAGGLTFTSYLGVTADLSVVFPGEPDNSRLMWSIEGSSSFPMPPISFPARLTKNQIQGVRTWILEGAKNN